MVGRRRCAARGGGRVLASAGHTSIVRSPSSITKQTSHAERAVWAPCERSQAATSSVVTSSVSNRRLHQGPQLRQVRRALSSNRASDGRHHSSTRNTGRAPIGTRARLVSQVPTCFEGHGRSPNEQSTQQSPFAGRKRSSSQCRRSNRHASIGIRSRVRWPKLGQVITDSTWTAATGRA